MSKLKRKHEILEYQVNIAFDPRDNIYVVRVPELEGCMTHGNTPELALKMAKEAIELWLETAKKKKIDIPEPLSRRRYSGRFVLRTSEELHAQLAQEAQRLGKSMNDLATEILQSGIRRTG